MRIVSWNCNLKLRSKFDKIEEFKPDILVVQECEKLPKDYFPNAHYLWVGRNDRKGLGVIIFGSSGKIYDKYNENLIEFLPVETDFGSILGVWAFNHRARKRFGEGVKGHILPAIDYYASFIDNKKVLGVIGDFNNSVIWDKPKSELTFKNAITKFESFGLQSAYHHLNSENFGEEALGTLFHMKNRNKKYHIDYMFLRNATSISVGSYENWIELSDHVPVIVDIQDL